MNAADPLQLQGYTYANNNPVTLWDPDGLWPKCGWCKKAKNATINFARDVGAQIINTGVQAVQQQIDTFRLMGSCVMGNGGCGEAYNRINPVTVAINTVKSTVQQGRQIASAIKNGNIRQAAVALTATAIIAITTRKLPIVGKKPPIRLPERAASRPSGGSGGGGPSGGGPSGGGPSGGGGNNVNAPGASGPGPNRGGGGCNSFVAGTSVLMQDGESKPIEEITVGDEVVATDPETGESGPAS